MASEEDFSDLTELESDNYVESKGRKKSSTKSGGKSGYRIRNALKVPRATTYTAQALYEQIHSCDINLEPEYQRDVVWPEAKQIGIIDSVFRNFYIPPVIFAVNTFEDGSETKTCIDGKQRLTSIHKFMDGLIPHKDPLSGEKLWYKDVQTMGKNSRARRLLPEEYRKTFANKQIVCVEYQDITDADEREIFQRVQLGMALTPSEKLQVIHSPRATFIREIQTRYLKEDGSLGGDSLDWDRSRGSDFRCISQAIYCMEKFSSALKGVTIIQLEKWLNLQEPFSSDFKAKISDSYRIFAELVQDRKLNKVFKKPTKVSPVEFTTIGLLVYVHKDTLTMAQLSSGIAKMRDDVRATYVDIRMNARVLKSMIDFIKSLQIPKIPGDTGGPAGATGSTAGLKRKRTEQQYESDDEEDSEDDGKTESQNPKTKKKSGPVSNAKPSGPPRNGSLSKAAAPSSSRVKAEPAPSPVVPSQAPKPAPSDRMAALRRAKEAIMQHQPLPAIPSGSRALPNNPNSFAEPNPQMLPSPNLSFSVPSHAGPSSNSNRPPIPNSYKSVPLPNSLPHPPSAAVIENSLMGSMMRPSVVTSATPLKWQDSQQQQPLSASSSSRRSSHDNKGPWDKSWDQDLEREQRDRERHGDWNYSGGSSGGRGGGRYHDEDERYGSHRGSRGSREYRRSSDEWRR